MAVADALGLDAAAAATPSSRRCCTTSARSKIPNEIINKPGPLDDAERALINTHTIEGERMLERVGGLLGDVGGSSARATSAGTAAAIRTGWPARTSRSSRGSCACDAFSAMTTDARIGAR